jgi:hypothetical protein
MTVFELSSCVVLGIVAGLVLTAFARWRSTGVQRALALGGLGGLVGGLVGASASLRGAAWDLQPYHLVVTASAIVGGLATVELLRLLGQASLRQPRGLRGP